MCGKLVNLDTVARVLADYYHLKTETQLAALDEALSKVPAVSVGGGHEKDHVADPGNMVVDLISRQAALRIFEEHCYPVRYDHNSIEKGMTLSGIVEVLNITPSAQPEKRTEKRTETHACDYISRQAAIDALSHMMDTDGFRDGWAVSRANVDCMLRSLPSAQPVEDASAMCGECDAWNQYKNYPHPGWIPCSERLPEKDGEYLTTTEDGLCDVESYGDGEWFYDDVVAWAPLPEPWKGEK